MLQIQNIVKRYSQHTALDNISMDVPSGSIFGLLGPNGAGKTSLIRIINQITAPDSGQILLNGEPLNQVHISRIGYLPEERGLYKKMQVGEQVLYFARLKGLSRNDAIKQSKRWFEKFEMQNWWEKKVEDLSKGMQQKVQFITTILHDPELLILDEPFSGFDPLNAEIVKNEIINFHKQGKTIIFSTHRLENIEEFVTHIALLNKSKKILDGDTKSIVNKYRSETYVVNYTGEGIKEFDWSTESRFSYPVITTNNADHAEYTGHTVNAGFAEHADHEEQAVHAEHAGHMDHEEQAVHAEHAVQTAVFKLKTGSVNDLLQVLLPLVKISGIKELIPTVSEIFIDCVRKAEGNTGDSLTEKTIIV